AARPAGRGAVARLELCPGDRPAAGGVSAAGRQVPAAGAVRALLAAGRRRAGGLNSWVQEEGWGTSFPHPSAATATDLLLQATHPQPTSHPRSPIGYTIPPMDRSCLTRVPTHGFTRKPFAGNSLNPLFAPCLLSR